jgi:hypothetical protein
MKIIHFYLLRLLYVTLPYNKKIEIMSNTELMNLSVEQLRDLNKRIIEVVKFKQQSVAFVNKEQLSKGMVAEYVGNSTNIHYKEFEIIKINRTKECKCVTGKLWTIQICKKPTEKTVELSHNYQQNRKTT